MKKLLIAPLLLLAACSHTEQENYTMANSVVGELTMINDSLTYLDSTLANHLPGNEAFFEDGKKGIMYSTFYVDSVSKSPDSLYGKMLDRRNVLKEHYNTYKEMFGLIYRELPKDSVAKNEQIRKSFEKVTKRQ